MVTNSNQTQTKIWKVSHKKLTNREIYPARCICKRDITTTNCIPLFSSSFVDNIAKSTSAKWQMFGSCEDWNIISPTSTLISILMLKSDSHLQKKIIFFIKSPLKLVKNTFYFILKAFLVLKIFKFLSWLFGYVEKTAWLKSSG